MTTKTIKTHHRRAPSHIVWFAPERENAPWTRIGAMWPTKSGNGYRQHMEVLPSSPGSIVVMKNTSPDKKAKA